MFLDFFPSLWMRVVFQAGSLGKDHWEIFVFFSLHQALNSFQHLCFSFLSLGNPPAHLRHQHLFSLQVLSECLASVPAGPKGPWLCHLGVPDQSLQPSSRAWLPKPPSSQTPVLKSCTVHLSHPDYPASSGCHSCFISAPIVTSCKQEVATFDWFCLAIIDSVSQCPTPLPQDLGIDSIIQEIIIEFPLWSTHWARCWQYSGKY